MFNLDTRQYGGGGGSHTWPHITIEPCALNHTVFYFILVFLDLLIGLLIDHTHPFLFIFQLLLVVLVGYTIAHSHS